MVKIRNCKSGLLEIGRGSRKVPLKLRCFSVRMYLVWALNRGSQEYCNIQTAQTTPQLFQSIIIARRPLIAHDGTATSSPHCIMSSQSALTSLIVTLHCGPASVRVTARLESRFGQSHGSVRVAVRFESPLYRKTDALSRPHLPIPAVVPLGTILVPNRCGRYKRSRLI